MTRVFIDTEELRATAHELKALGDEVGELRDRLRRAFAHTVIIPPASLRLGIEHEAAQMRLLALRGQLAIDGAWLDTRAGLVETEEAVPWIGPLAGTGVSLIRPFAASAWSHITWGIGYVSQEVRSAATALINDARAGLQVLNTLAVASASAMFEGVHFIKSVTGKVVSGALNVVTGIVNKFTWILKRLWSALTETWHEAAEAITKIRHFVHDAWHHVAVWVGGAVIWLDYWMSRIQVYVVLQGLLLLLAIPILIATFVESGGDLTATVDTARDLFGYPDGSVRLQSRNIERPTVEGTEMSSFSLAEYFNWIDDQNNLPEDSFALLQTCTHPSQYVVLLRGIGLNFDADATDAAQAYNSLNGGWTRYEQAVLEALRAEGVPKDASLSLIGHSQGGIVANNLASNSRFSEYTNIDSVVAFASPTQTIPQRQGTDYLTINSTHDPVPDLFQITLRGPQPERTFSTLTVAGPPFGHSFGAYKDPLAGLEDNPKVSAMESSLHGCSSDYSQSLNMKVFEISRSDEAVGA